MASAEQQDLVPDDKLLASIFPGVHDIKAADCRMIANTHHTCTFSLHLEASPLPGYPKDLVVRLETTTEKLASVATLQRFAHAQLADLVPSVLDVGSVTATDGRELEYSVTAFYTDTTTLEDVWDTLDPGHQVELVDAVVQAVEKLHAADRGAAPIAVNTSTTPTRPGCAASESKTWIGGPPLGYFPNIRHFLRGVLQANSPKTPACELLETDDGGIVVKSTFSDIGSVELTAQDFDDLQHRVVFCHNDLEPRNILVRKTSGHDGSSPRYELAAIIDWEMAGFYPFAYESGLKDCVLGSSNLSFTWYSLFKQRTAHLLPEGMCHTKFIQCLGVIFESRKRRMTRNVGLRIQAKWMGHHELERSSNHRLGWVRRFNAEPPRDLTKEKISNLELEVLRELGRV